MKRLLRFLFPPRRRWALLAPLFVCFLGMLPGVGNLPGPRTVLVWLEDKITDVFFAFSAFPPPVEQVVVVAKDQAAIEYLGREPERGDFATVLETLASAGVAVCALDFVYDQQGDPESTARLTAALAALPHAIVATRFSRAVHFADTGAAMQLSSADTDRPPAPLPLIPGMVGAASDLGFINVFPGFDGVVRDVPLAFFPEEDGFEFAFLGAAAWIAARLHDVRERAFPPGTPALPELPEPDVLAEWLKARLETAPFPLGTTGHAGFDRLIRSRELACLVEASLPVGTVTRAETGRIREVVAGLKCSELPARSWFPWPRHPFPWLGSPFSPRIRLPQSKLPFPLVGDGVKTFSLAHVLQAAAGQSVRALPIGPDSGAGSVPQSLRFDVSPFGKGVAEGVCLSVSGRPMSGVEVVAWDVGSGFWATATVDPEGKYRLTRLPVGRYQVEMTHASGSCTQLLCPEQPFAVGTGTTLLPTAWFLEPNVVLVGSCTPATFPRTLHVTGDGVWLGRSGPAGELPEFSPPPGFTPAAVEDEEEYRWQASPSCLIRAKNGDPARLIKVALLEEVPAWKTRISARQTIPAGATGFRLEGLVPAVGAGYFLTHDAAEAGRGRSLEIDLFHGETVEISSLPVSLPVQEQGIPVKFSALDVPAGPGRIFIQDSRGVFSGHEVASIAVTLPPGLTRFFLETWQGRGLVNPLKTAFFGKTVFLGTTLAEDLDFVRTPINFLESEFTRIPGVNLHAQLFSALSRETFLRPTFLHPDGSGWKWALWVLVLLLPLCLLLDGVFARFGAFFGGGAVLASGALWLIAVQRLFEAYLLVPSGLPLLALASFGTARAYQSYLDERDREQKARFTFGRFVSSRMVEEILKNPDSLRPGGEKTELTVMFTDLAGFTTMSEIMTPENLVAMMNEYLGSMTAVLFEHGGTLDKYIGDAVMGFWNFPQSQPDHAERACRCVLEMNRRLKDLRVKWRGQGYPEVFMRAGMNTAQCIVGFIGSDIQMNFTCLGDGVNLAARLEGANKAFDTLIMIAESTRSRLGGTNLRTRFLDFLAVKGKAIPIKVYELIGEQGEDDALWEKLLPVYDRGIAAYLGRDWKEAIGRFEQVLGFNPNDGPAKVYIARCRAFQEEPPPESWDGSYTMKHK
jgi:class 3 adenylate cyclase